VETEPDGAASEAGDDSHGLLLMRDHEISRQLRRLCLEDLVSVLSAGSPPDEVHRDERWERLADELVADILRNFEVRPRVIIDPDM
jgi:hypothetical protein